MGACVGLKRSLAVLPPHLGIEVMRGGALSSGIVLFVKAMLKYGLHSVRPALPESRSFQMVLEVPRCF
eukprot:jgi/Chrzof1/13655/Cz08g06120.t1